MLRVLGAGVLVCGLLCACAAPPVATLPEARLWQDAVFHYDPKMPIESPESLFALDAAVVNEARTSVARNMSPERRVNALLGMLYDERGIRLAYNSGHTTGAMQTWTDKKGDCLSLSILAYALAREMGLSATMQDVPVPPVIDRREEAEYISRHVNVRIPTRAAISIDGRVLEPGGIVIDFQPQAGAMSRGMLLDENQILARFYNNRATEYLTSKQDDLAYAYYRVAIAADPHYGPAYSNLAVLYARRDLKQAAEDLLWQAVALDKYSDAPLRTLRALYSAQGRKAEADKVALLLERLKDRDPYYWLNQGVAALKRNELNRSISALERAEELATGFEEIHYHLAIAYARNGEREKASKQIALLDAINHHDPNIALLTKKLQSITPKPGFVKTILF